jgi:hypothetical protein
MITQETLHALYVAAINRGEGFAPDAETVEMAVETYALTGLARVLVRRCTTSEVSAVELSDGRTIVIVDTNGAWAAEVKL